MKNLISALLLLAPASVHAQTALWNTTTDSALWSVGGNWTFGSAASPAATAVTFGSTGVNANATTVSNVVDTSYTGTDSLLSLTYNGNSTGWQVTQIASPQTLTVAGNFTVGGLSGASQVTNAAFTGTGSLVINNSTSTVTIANTGATSALAVLDMSALSTFSATVSAFNVGTGTTGFGTAYLADTSTITASTLTTGGGGSGYGSAVSNKLYFGTTTTLNVDALAFAKDRTYGSIKFRASGDGAANNTTVSGATLTIRGSTGGTSRATTMTLGDSSGVMPSSGGTSTLNLAGGSVDAMVGTLTVGNSSNSLNSTANLTATMSMAAGIFDATTVIVGQTVSATAGTGTLTGNLNVSGGTFTAGTMTLANNTGSGNTRAAKGNLTISGTTTAVNVTGNLVMGNRTSATVTPKVDISGGTLTVDGTLAEGTGTASSIVSAVNLSGGKIILGGTMTVDAFAFTGGTLQLGKGLTTGALATGLVIDSDVNAANLTINRSNAVVQGTDFSGAAIAGALSFTQAGAGTTTLNAANTYTGLTTVSAGELDLNTTGGQSIAGDLAVSGGTAKLLQASQINSAKNLVVSGGTFDLQGFNQTLAGVQLTAGTIAGTSGVLSSTTDFDMQAGSVSAILGGSVGLTKTNAGTVTLSGSNNYTGPTLVSGGTLEIRGSISGGMVAVNAGTFGGAGTVTTNDKSFTLGSGAKLDPGTNGSTGLSVNTGTSSVDISAGVGGSNTGALLFNLDTVSSSDKVTLTLGTLAIGNGLLDFADFNFTAGGGFGAGTYTLFSLDDTNATLSGTLAGSGLTGTIAGFDATLTFSGNDIDLMVIPEPNAAVSLLGGFGLLLGLQRRRWRGVKRS